jgi:RNA polymerase sigma factor (sigma-70 family)
VRDIHTDPDESGHDSNFILHETSPNNLTQYRWRGPILSPGEVADNLRAARGPEPGAAAAKDTLFKAFDRLVLKVVQPYCRDDGRNDDLIAAGMLGLVEAIDRFDARRNNGFAAYAIPLIRGRAQKASKVFNRNGWAGETRLQRAVYGNHDLTLEQASKRMGRPGDEGEIEQARTEVLGMCSEPLPYDTTEPGFEDDDGDGDEEGKPCLVAVAPPCPRQHIFNAALEKRHGRLNRLAEDADRRARQRLKEIGRRAYALELVEQDRARIAARAEPTQYLYGPGVADPFGYILALLGISPRSSKPKSRTQKKRRPRIRAWRCSEPAALAANI